MSHHAAHPHLMDDANDPPITENPAVAYQATLDASGITPTQQRTSTSASTYTSTSVNPTTTTSQTERTSIHQHQHQSNTLRASVSDVQPTHITYASPSSIPHASAPSPSPMLSIHPSAPSPSPSTLHIHVDDTPSTRLPAPSLLSNCSHPITITLHDVSLSLPKPMKPWERIQYMMGDQKKREYQMVLQHVSGEFKPGQVVGIMGGSGSGKTTLINIMAGRARGIATRTGDVLFNGKARPEDVMGHGIKSLTSSMSHLPLTAPPIISSSTLDSRIGYVLQQDYLFPTLTVRETLRYAARLRLPAHMDLESKYKRVDAVILELGLKECADTLCGGELVRGISGGEKRRVSVAIQMLTDPSILFLDEPTTGLDASTALKLIETLTKLAAQGRTVVCSIHQPRSAIFTQFDVMMMLSKGRVVYQGPPLGMHSYFGALGYICPPATNPADYFIDIASVDVRDTKSEIESRARVETLVRAYDEWSLQHSHESKSAFTSHPSDDESDTPTSRGASIFQQMMVLSRRATLDLVRDRIVLAALLAQTLMVSLWLGVIFLDDGRHEEQANIQSRTSVLYMTSAQLPYLMMIYWTYRFSQELPIFDHEREDHMYSIIPYMFSQIVSTLPILVSIGGISGIMVYYMVGLRPGTWHILYYLVIMCTNQCISYTFAWVCVALHRNFAISSLIANSITTFTTLSSGYFVNSKSIPIFLQWFRYISWTHLGFAASATNEYSDRTIGISPGNMILENLDIDENYYVWPIVYMGIIIGTCLVVTYLLLRFLPKYSQVSGEGSVSEPILTSSSASASAVSSRRPSISISESNYISIDDPHIHPSTTHVNVSIMHLNYSVEKKTDVTQGKKLTKILNDVNAYLRAGELTVIMGASGSGKSTLLNILAGRSDLTSQQVENDTPRSMSMMGHDTKKGSHISGSVSFNGQILTQHTWSGIVGYVMQSDYLLPMLTVRETLMYAAKLRLPTNMTYQQKLERVDRVILELGLKDCQHVRIGDDHVRGVSGGERRRVTIGVQLLLDPPVLLLDEPTSGLDSFTAHHITQTLKSLASAGRTIICSIHQPRSDVYNLFDHVLLLSHGHLLYADSPHHVDSYFGTLGLTCPPNTNPADWLLDMSTIDLRNATAESDTRALNQRLITAYREKKVESRIIPHDDETDVKLPIQGRTAATLTHAFPILLSRSWINFSRQPLLVMSRVMQVLAFGVILALYFYDSMHLDQLGAKNRLGLIQEFSAIVFVGMLNCIAVFPSERNVFYREVAEGTYGTLPFFLSYLLFELIFELFAAILFTLIIIFIVGFQYSSISMGYMIIVVVCLINAGESMGIIFCSIVYNPGISVTITNVFISVFVTMAGVMSLRMGSFLNGLNNISLLHFETNLLANIELSNLIFTCPPEPPCLFPTGESVLQLYGFVGFDRDYYLGIAIVCTCIYRFLGFVALWRSAQKQRYVQ